MSNIALIFPGQGSQAVGMGKNFYENSDIAKNIFDNVDSILEKPLSKLCFDGPEEELMQTINTQPAILTVSIIAYELLRSKFDVEAKYTAGHSLGEYSALYASNVLDLESVVKLVKKRAQLMHNAPRGAMSAILGLPQEAVEQVVEKASSKGIVTIANYNTPEQLVISGEPDAVNYASELAKEAGAKRALALPVSGAFHSPLMEEAARNFAEEVNQYQYCTPKSAVITNVDAKPSEEGFEQKLIKQIYSSVLWTQTMEYIKDQNINTFIELGPGKVLAGMVKKFDRKLKVYNIYDMESLENTLNALGASLNV